MQTLEELRATKLPIQADRTDEFNTTAIYSMPNQPGLYRRVTRDGRSGLKTGNGNIVALIGEWSLYELRRWREGEELLRPLLPGTESPIDQEDNPL